jgi:adenylate cyclase
MRHAPRAISSPPSTLGSKKGTERGRVVEPAPELAELAERILQTFVTGKVDQTIEAISCDAGALFIGTDPDEWATGHERISAFVRVQEPEIPAYRLRVEEIVGWKSGEVGWVAARMFSVLEGSAPIPQRLTAVFIQEGTYWRVVQWHVSIGVTNKESLGVDLTTSVDETLMSVTEEMPPGDAVGLDGSVTIVFTDIEGSAATMESVGDRRWLRLLDWHRGVVSRQTALFGGRVVKDQGDGFMLAFPASGSAVACSIAIQRALREGWEGIAVPVRIGMDCGDLKAEAGDFFGRTVVIAARIASAARGAEILVSHSVKEELSGAFALGNSRTVVLKGIMGEQSVFPVLCV